MQIRMRLLQNSRKQSRKENNMVRNFAAIAAICILMTGCTSYGTAENLPSETDTASAAEMTCIQEDAFYQRAFRSKDHSVSFQFDFSGPVSAGAVPQMTVTPHDLREQDVKKTAEILFGKVDFYAPQPRFAAVYTRDEIKSKLARWIPYTDEAAAEKLFGEPVTYAIPVIQKSLEDYQNLLESAPDTVNKTPCPWKYQPSWHYSYTEDQIEAANILVSEDVEIQAESIVDGIPYIFTAASKNVDQSHYNTLYAGVNLGISPWDIDKRILERELCRVQKPSKEDADRIGAAAEAKLNDMPFGKWKVQKSKIVELEYGKYKEYQILVSAAPVIHGYSAIERPPLAELQNPESHLPIYPLSSAEFLFAPNGTLLHFTLNAPTDFSAADHIASALLSTDALLRSAEDYFKESNVQEYGIGIMPDDGADSIECEVILSSIRYGITRMREPDATGSYTYVPAIGFYGSTKTWDPATGEIYAEDEDRTFLILNATNGEVIPLYDTEN